MILSLAFLALSFQSKWQAGLGFFQPVQIQGVAYSKDTGVYAANFKDGHIVHLDVDGRLLRKFGQPGQGPGDLDRPWRLFFDQTKLYVVDAAAISVFAGDGTFLERVRIPSHEDQYFKVQEGWVRLPRTSFASEWVQMERLDNALEPEGELLSLKGGEKYQNRYRKILNPAEDTFHVAVTRDGRTLFACGAGDHEIQVLGSRGEALSRIHQPFEPISFNRAWGEAAYKRQVEAIAKNLRIYGFQGRKPEYEMRFPNFFPMVKQLLTDSRGNLVVVGWSESPEESEPVKCFRRDGGEIPAPFSAAAYRRLIGMDGDVVFLTAFEDGEAAIACIQKQHVDGYVREHPIEFDYQAAVFGRR